jgi:hypothetical protein
MEYNIRITKESRFLSFEDSLRMKKEYADE